MATPYLPFPLLPIALDFGRGIENRVEDKAKEYRNTVLLLYGGGSIKK